ncbi:hypothetical protein DFS34DRAFT_352401 [Phlyctochytrium arcticum]|nr:hypothetical protein DFS34DRAFT_352401 [Phlyctochytrium arcticum]
MFTAAYIMAKKSHCESFAGICASVLAEIFERKGDPERVAKYSALRDEHQQKAQFAQLEVASLMEVESAKFENEKAAMTVNEHKQERSVTPATKAQPGEQPKLPGPAHVKEEKFEPEDDVPTLRTPKPRSRRKSSSSKTTKRAPRATAITVPNQKRSPDPITAVASETAQAALQHQLHQLPSDLHNSSASNPMHINSQQDLLPATVQLYDENKQHNSAKNSEMIPQGTNIYELSQEQNGVQPLSTSQSVPLHQFTSQQQFAQSMPPPYPQHLPHMPQQMPNAPYANFLQPTPPKSFHHQSPHQPKQLRDSQMPYPSPSPLDQRRQMEQFQWQQQQQQQRNVYPGQFSQQQSPATPYLSAQHSAYHPMYHNQPQMQLQHDPMLHPNYNVANPHPAHQRQQLISQDMPDIMNNPFDMNSSPMMQDLNWQPPHAEQSPGAYSKTHSSQSSQHSGSHRSYNGQNTQ